MPKTKRALAFEKKTHARFKVCLLDKSERLGRLERRQDAGEPRGKHRLAGARRTDHQQVVAARRGDFQRALGALLAFDVLEVEPSGARRRELGLGRRQQLCALEMIDDREGLAPQ